MKSRTCRRGCPEFCFVGGLGVWFGEPMVAGILGVAVGSFVISWIATFAMIRIAPRIGFVDKPGHRKIHSNPKPLGGGVAVFWSFALPILVGLSIIHFVRPPAVAM